MLTTRWRVPVAIFMQPAYPEADEICEKHIKLHFIKQIGISENHPCGEHNFTTVKPSTWRGRRGER
jgi:hypothetical protein